MNDLLMMVMRKEVGDELDSLLRRFAEKYVQARISKSEILSIYIVTMLSSAVKCAKAVPFFTKERLFEAIDAIWDQRVPAEMAELLKRDPS